MTREIRYRCATTVPGSRSKLSLASDDHGDSPGKGPPPRARDRDELGRRVPRLGVPGEVRRGLFGLRDAAVSTVLAAHPAETPSIGHEPLGRTERTTSVDVRPGTVLGNLRGQRAPDLDAEGLGKAFQPRSAPPGSPEAIPDPQRRSEIHDGARTVDAYGRGVACGGRAREVTRGLRLGLDPDVDQDVVDVELGSHLD